MEDNMFKIGFSYTDEFGQETKLEKTLSDIVLMDYDTLNIQLDEFKKFLIAQGHSRENVDKIQYIKVK
jgi:hypothetical protein